MPFEYKLVRRVEFSETDMAGIMHFANFFRMMEAAEHAFFRSLGFSIHERGEGETIGWPRVSASCDYQQPLRFEDEVEIHLLVAELRTRSIRYQFIFRKIGGEGEVARGQISAVCAQVDSATGKLIATAIPERIRAQISAAPADRLPESLQAALLTRAPAGQSITHLLHLFMESPSASSSGNSWLVFALSTVFFWGVYGVFLATGQMNMADPVNARWKSFLFVGLAYFLVAVLAPLLLLLVRGASWKYPAEGMGWSLIAGIAGAIGAFGVLLAFGAHGVPSVVMAIVFAGAPIVNAFVSLVQHPPAGGWGGIKPQFWAGIAVAALGGCLVTLYKPAVSHGHAAVGDVGHTWLIYSLLTVFAWGVYGVLLHTGQMHMKDPANGRYKAFLFVGLAYLLVAVIVPSVMLAILGANWHYPVAGMSWSLIAGVAGALGAFGVLLAFGAKGIPSVVMAIVFAGAPVVNAVVSLIQRPPASGIGSIHWLFWTGILLAAVGGCLVTLFKPTPAPARLPATEPAPAVPQHA